MSHCIICGVACSCKHRQSSGAWSCRILCQTDYWISLSCSSTWKWESPNWTCWGLIRTSGSGEPLAYQHQITHADPKACEDLQVSCSVHQNGTEKTLTGTNRWGTCSLAFGWYTHTVVSFFFMQTVLENKTPSLKLQRRAHNCTPVCTHSAMPGGGSGLGQLRDWNTARHILMQSQRVKRRGSGAFANTSWAAPVAGSETKQSIFVQIPFLQTHRALITVRTTLLSCANTKVFHEVECEQR